MTISTEQFISVNTGLSSNDGTGDSLRAAFIKVNENFNNISDIGFDAGNINCQGGLEVSDNVIIQGTLLVSNTANITGNVTAGNVAATNLTGTLLTAAQTNITSVGTLTGLTVNTTTAAISLSASGTTSTFILGGTAQTGTIGIGRSTVTHTINIGNGAVSSGNVKSLNIGTAGVSGSTTNIIVGTNIAGANGNIELQSNVLFESTYVPSSASASGTLGQIALDTNYIYICTAVNTWKRANLVAW